MHVYVCTYVRICMYVCTICTYIHIYECMYVHTYVRIHVHSYIYMYVHTYVYAYVCASSKSIEISPIVFLRKCLKEGESMVVGEGRGWTNWIHIQ